MDEEWGRCAWARMRVRKRGTTGVGGSLKPASVRVKWRGKKGGLARANATRSSGGGGVGVDARWVGVMDWHGTDMAPPGCSDSGVRRISWFDCDESLTWRDLNSNPGHFDSFTFIFMSCGESRLIVS
jgi:hypothetical protein